jgi:hypothetical protein
LSSQTKDGANIAFTPGKLGISVIIKNWQEEILLEIELA